MSLDLVRDIKKEEKLLDHIEELVRSTGEAGDDLRNSADTDDQVGKQVQYLSTPFHTNTFSPVHAFRERDPGGLSLRSTMPLITHTHTTHTHNNNPVGPLNRADTATLPPTALAPSLALSLSLCRRCSGWRTTCSTASGCITR